MQQTTEQKGLLDLLAKVLTFAKSEKARLLPYELRYRDWETDRKSTRLNSSHSAKSRMPSSA